MFCIINRHIGPISHFIAQKEMVKCDYCEIVLVDDGLQCQVAVPCAALCRQSN